MNVSSPSRGAVIRAGAFAFEREHGCEVARPICPAIGAHQVLLEVVRIPPAGVWRPRVYQAEEDNVVIFSGVGHAEVTGVRHAIVELASGIALQSPTGCDLLLQSASDGEVVAYVWRSRLAGAVPNTGTTRRLVSSIWNTETQLIGFTGYGGLADPDARPATMNFIFWPGTGSPHLCLHCGIQQAGETFNIHFHPRSEEAFVAIEGQGQVFLFDQWVDVEAGDVLFAPPGVPHGARNPHPGSDARRFVTCGGPTPFDPMLYQRAGVSAEVV